MGLTFRPFKRLVVFIFSIIDRLIVQVRIWKLQTNLNIKIEDFSRISPDSEIKINYGGSIRIGKNTEILRGVIINTYGGNIEIGQNCSINPYSIIYGHGNTKIGNNVLIAGACMIIPSNHKFTNTEVPINQQGAISKGILIEDDVWLGHGCTILDDVVIGRGAVVAAGSVVTKNVLAMSVVAGVPAKLIKMRNE